MDFFTSDEVAVIWNTATEISSEILRASKVITVIRKAANGFIKWAKRNPFFLCYLKFHESFAVPRVEPI